MKKIILLSALLMTVSICQAESFDLTKLSSLQRSGQSAAAYSYGLIHLAEMEGDAEFDFYFGIAAIDAGFASQGVFALERVLVTEPDNHLARLELARGYFLLEEYERSNSEFLSIMALDPPKHVRQNIQRYLDAIKREQGRYRTTVVSYFEFGVGTDDNVNSGPENSRIFFPLLAGDLLLPNSTISQEDSYSNFSGGMEVDVPLSPTWTFFTSFDLDTRQHQEFDIFDTDLIQAKLGLGRTIKKDRYSISFDVQKFDVAGEDYRDLSGFSFDWRRQVSLQSQFQFFMQYSAFEYETQPLRNSDFSTLGIGYIKEFNGRTSPLFYMNVYLGDESPESNTVDARSIAERDLHGFNLGMQLNLSSSWTLGSTLAFQSSEYGATSTIFESLRVDDYSYLSLDFGWSMAKAWTMQTVVSYAKNDSTIVLNNYDRMQIGINFRYEFGS